MLLLLLFPYGVVFYFGLGLTIPLLSSIDDALAQIFSLGRYAIYVTVFILTYKLFANTSSGGSHRLVSTDALKYWKFLNRSNKPITYISALKLEMQNLILTLNAMKQEERDMYTILLKRRKFNMEVVADRLQCAADIFDKSEANSSCKATGEETKALESIKKLQLLTDILEVDLKSFEEDIKPVVEWVERLNESRNLSNMEQKGIKKLTAGINQFRMTLVRIVGVPPMYLNRDKANALTAALIYQKVNSLYSRGRSGKSEQADQGTSASVRGEQLNEATVPEGNERYSLLLSLIEEDF